MTLLQRLISAEIPPLPERHRPWLTAYMALYAVSYAVVFVATVHFVFLGPGLPDEVTYRHVLHLLDQALELDRALGAPLFVIAFAALVLWTTVMRGWIIYRGYSEYPTGMGEAVPLNEALALIGVNLFNILFMPLLLLALAAIAPAFGYRPERGWAAVEGLVTAANTLMARVPTLVELPRFVAFICTLMGMTFIHYWLHRFSHDRRALWLLLHRPHHMTRHLCYGTTMPVFMAFPLFLVIALPYTLLFGAMAKLFSPTPIYAEMILFQLLISVGEIYGHSPALYEKAIRQRWVRALSFINCQGVYHVLHHSASADIVRGNSNNAVNLGSGPFSCWDIAFGTFRPLTPKPPELGLQGMPRLHLNPLRLLLSGVMQLAWELRHNSGVRSRLNILLGPCTYAPPMTRDFAIHPPEGPSENPPRRVDSPDLALDLASGRS